MFQISQYDNYRRRKRIVKQFLNLEKIIVYKKSLSKRIRREVKENGNYFAIKSLLMKP